MRIPIALLLVLATLHLTAQKPDLSYYLPQHQYNPDIPTPESFLGFQIGEWHVSHDQVVYYMRALAAASDRVRLQEYGRSHEDRSLQVLQISSRQNLENIDDIKSRHQQLSDPTKGDQVDIDNLPAVILQGYGVHGNEASGTNASLLVAYYLAASQNPDVVELLDNVVVLLDPCFNPDGTHRFATWVNMHKSQHPVSNTDSREFVEPWPGGRTNHYWFDLNRDWLLATHPESQGRLNIFYEWLPNILTDHHEMGSNATFFFQPGIPSRTNPITPERNQELTRQIGAFHARALDDIGSLYYSEESFDDYYYGKGSTFPDVNGCIGILFEQASARGHLRQTTNGLLSFPFAIRNQVVTSLSTQRAALEMRTELLAYKRSFFQDAANESRNTQQRGYIFGENHDHSRLAAFIELLRRHQIEVYAVDKAIDINGKRFDKGQAYAVPMAQKQARLIRAVFETPTTFRDSLFYDVSTWTLPLAFNIEYQTIYNKMFTKSLLGKKVSTHHHAPPAVSASKVGYLMKWDDYYAPRVLAKILDKGYRAKVAEEPFSLKKGKQALEFDVGTIFIPVQNQKGGAGSLLAFIKQLNSNNKITFHTVESGWTPEGIDLGSNKFRPLKKPKVLLVAGSGTTAYDVGEVWHLLDQRYEMPPVIVATDRLSGVDLNKYTHLVLVNGSYGPVGKSVVEKIKTWVRGGGVLVCAGNAIRWAQSQGLANVTIKKMKPEKDKKTERRPYSNRAADRGADVIGGAIFEMKLDRTHPLFFGYRNSVLPVFRRGTLALEAGKNAYATPSVYTKNALRSGYASAKNREKINESAAIVVTGIGRGRVICLTDKLNFRGFWYGTNKLFANTLFFGHLISSQAVESAPAVKK